MCTRTRPPPASSAGRRTAPRRRSPRSPPRLHDATATATTAFRTVSVAARSLGAHAGDHRDTGIDVDLSLTPLGGTVRRPLSSAARRERREAMSVARPRYLRAAAAAARRSNCRRRATHAHRRRDAGRQPTPRSRFWLVDMTSARSGSAPASAFRRPMARARPRATSRSTAAHWSGTGSPAICASIKSGSPPKVPSPSRRFRSSLAARCAASSSTSAGASWSRTSATHLRPSPPSSPRRCATPISSSVGSRRRNATASSSRATRCRCGWSTSRRWSSSPSTTRRCATTAGRASSSSR